MKQGLPGSISTQDWLIQNLISGSIIGFDPELIRYQDGVKMKKRLKAAGLIPIDIPGNLIDEFWNNRPALQGDLITVLGLEESGKSISDKVQELREKLQKKQFTGALFTLLDDVMWLLNIRGSDIPYNSLAYSYLLITMDSIDLFIDKKKLDRKAKLHLVKARIRVHSYENVYDWLNGWLEKKKEKKERVMIQLAPEANFAIGSVFGEENSMIETSLVQVGF